MNISLRKTLALSGLTLGMALLHGEVAAGDSDTLHWKTMTGIGQALNVVGTGSGAVTGGGAPWSAQGGHAHVDLQSGYVSFAVQGLVFAGGNAIGTPGTVAQVKGTLVCDTGGASGGNSVLVDTPLVELDEQGNAQFSGSVGALPPSCRGDLQTAFLIRVGANRWIANASVLR